MVNGFSVNRLYELMRTPMPHAEASYRICSQLRMEVVARETYLPSSVFLSLVGFSIEAIAI